MTFQIGDKVRANGREGTLVRYNEEADRLAVAVVERGGAVNTIESHISTTSLVKVEEDEDLTGLFNALATIDGSGEEAPALSVVPAVEDEDAE